MWKTPVISIDLSDIISDINGSNEVACDSLTCCHSE